MKIAVFCSANKNIDPDFFTLTEEMGKWMAENGHDLVFGGCNSGLMDCIGKAVKANGGRTIGVVPTLVERGGRTFPDLDIEIPCDNLSDRKDLMLAQSDIFVALPGGVGTLDEIFTIAAAHTIGYHHKMVILYNMKGFWNSTIALLDDMAEKSMIRGDWRDVIEVADNLEELTKLCEDRTLYRIDEERAEKQLLTVNSVNPSCSSALKLYSASSFSAIALPRASHCAFTSGVIACFISTGSPTAS